MISPFSHTMPSPYLGTLFPLFTILCLILLPLYSLYCPIPDQPRPQGQALNCGGAC